MKDKLKAFGQKYRSMKDSINPNIGKIVEKVFFYIVIITTFLFIPVVFTSLSMLMGNGVISSGAYYGVFYTTWIVLFIAFFTWRFFSEYKYK